MEALSGGWLFYALTKRADERTSPAFLADVHNRYAPSHASSRNAIDAQIINIARKGQFSYIGT